GRAVAGPGASYGRADRPGDHRDQPGRYHGGAGRAERRDGARGGQPRLRPHHRRGVAVRTRRRVGRGRLGAQPLPGPRRRGRGGPGAGLVRVGPADAEPVDTVTPGHPIGDVTPGHPMDAVTPGHPVDAVTPGHPVDAVTAARTVDAVTAALTVDAG